MNRLTEPGTTTHDNKIALLRPKFADEIKLYGITSVIVSDGRVYVDSAEKLPYELFNSIECFLL